MARPIKEGLTYFPLDTEDSMKTELLVAEFGMKGYGIFINVLKLIYREKGYYSQWTEEVELLFGRKIGISPGDNSVSEVIKTCLRRNIFNQELYDKHSILTSEGIQERYLEAVKRRKEITMIKEYILLSVNDNKVNVNNTEVNVNIYSINVATNKQSKGKKRKVNESKEEKSIYGTFKNVLLTPLEYEKVKHLKVLDVLDNLSNYIESTGKKYKSHYATILAWGKKDNKYSVKDMERMQNHFEGKPVVEESEMSVEERQAALDEINRMKEEHKNGGR